MGQEVFSREGTLLTGYQGEDEKVLVPADVTQVGRYAFYRKGIHTVEMPEGLTRLQEGAFRSCKMLRSIRFSQKLEAIDRYVFADCWNLERLELPSGLQMIDDYAFHHTALKEVRIPESVTEIGEHAFDTRGTLRIAVIPGSVRMIGYCAFRGASDLEIHAVPGSAAEIYARKNGIRCVNLKEPAPEPTPEPTPEPDPEPKPQPKPSENLPGNVRRTIFETLGTVDQACYRLIVEGLMRMDDQIDLRKNGVYVMDAAAVWKAIELDYPQIFWVDWSKTGTSNPAKISPVYWISREQREARQKELDAAAAEFLSGISPYMEDYDKALLVFQRLVSAVDYDSVGLARQKKMDWKDRGVDDLRTVYGALVKKQCVCVGYAVGYQYLLHALGMEAVQRVGWELKDNDAGHAWTIVKMDGDYYHIDVTHSDGSNTDPQKDSSGYSMCHFGVTDEEIDKIWTPGDQRLPRCTATKCNYFVREGLYFEEYDQEKIIAALRRKLKSPSVTQVELKLAGPEESAQAFEWLRSSGILSRLHSEAGRSGEIRIASEKYNVIKVLF